MKKLIIIALGAAALLAAVFYAAPFQGAPQPTLARLFPSGPLLYLEAKDFSADLRDWNASGVQQRWLASDEYESFQRSNLFLKLNDAWKEFSGAAGFVPDSALLESVAGGQSAIAIYDIGNLEFLYVTRMPTARAAQTLLWQSRAKYGTRHAGGVDFYVRVESGRTVAFASTADYLILGTREELVAGALRLMAGEPLAPASRESWFADTAAAAGAPGDLRLVLNLEALLKTPQYRSYWIQRNASDVRQYRAGIADLVRTPAEIREERLFLRNAPTAAVAGDAGALLALAPDDAAFCRSWAKPDAAQVTALVEAKLLAPKVTARVSEDYAPEVQAGSGETGAESDLETRIDEPPLAADSGIVLDDWRRLIGSVQLDGVLEVQSGEDLPDGVLVETPTVLAISAAGPWDGAAVRNAIGQAAASLWKVNVAGTGWTAHQSLGHTWYSLDGLAPLEMAAEGNVLFLADSESALAGVLARTGRRAASSNSTTVALFRHQAARDDYRKIMILLDRAHPQGARTGFFSTDLWSLSEVFSNLREVELRTRDSGASVAETLIYRLH